MDHRSLMPSDLVTAFQQVRNLSEEICAPLAIEDFGLQAIAETSPLKWHLAHTTWFFETFLLKPFARQYQPFHSRFESLFNSYYNSVGEQFPRASRHLLSRPGVRDILAYRAYVNEHMERLLTDQAASEEEIGRRLELGLHHEQQHQELMLTDLKYNFAQNPLYPVYREAVAVSPTQTTQSSKQTEVVPLQFLSQAGGEHWIGHNPEAGFAFDNESPRHAVLLQPHAIANRLVTNAEFLDFMRDGGYERPEFWLADGWAQVKTQGWRQPLHWREQNREHFEFTLHGLQPVSPLQPVTHISFYEADAYARWKEARLCTEFEWEAAAYSALEGTGTTESITGQLLFSLQHVHPSPANDSTPGLQQMFAHTWQWTASAYLPYPGYKTAEGALGEYNGKFMCNQMVLRGSSCATPPGHARPSYRNFFYPQDRWQFTGIRLARDV